MGAALTTAGRLRLLECAFDQGIRHFDTAPLYGMGLAEEVLGRFVRERRGEITLTTKFGLVPRAIPAPLRPIVPLARILNRRLGGRWTSAVRDLLPRQQAPRGLAPQRQNPQGLDPAGEEPQGLQPLSPAAVLQAPAAASPYSAAALRGSLEASLRKLGTDHIDFFLLHECQPGQLNAETLALLEELVAEGKIGRWGLGSGRGASRAILEDWPGLNGVVQIPDDLLRRDTAWFARHAAPPLFTHSVFQTPLRDLAYQPTLAALLGPWAELTGQDPTRPDLLGGMLLIGGLLNNPEGCLVFSSSRVERIRAQAGVAARLPSLGPPLRELLVARLGEEAGGQPCS